jgi:CBS domain-containing protein
LGHGENLQPGNERSGAGRGAAMDRPLREVVRRLPITCDPDVSIESALRTMHGQGVGSLIVADAERRPLGIFTLQDLLGRVVLPRRDLADPVSSVMSPGVVALPPAATAYDAALAMVRQGIRHVVVVDRDRVVGIVSEKDLFALQRTGLRQLSHEIRDAPDLAALVALAGEVRSLAESRFAQGVSSEQLTRLISSLNDLLTRRVVELELAAADPGAGPWCWLALGSEGRHEQTLATDQDNGLVFEAPGGESADAVRERLLPFALRVNKALEACGFPLCTGG